MTITDSVARIQDATGEQRLVAAMLVLAAEDCRTGDPTACDWLIRCGPGALEIVALSGREDLDVLIRRLLPDTDVQLRLEAA